MKNSIMKMIVEMLTCYTMS